MKILSGYIMICWIQSCRLSLSLYVEALTWNRPFRQPNNILRGSLLLLRLIVDGETDCWRRWRHFIVDEWLAKINSNLIEALNVRTDKRWLTSPRMETRQTLLQIQESSVVPRRTLSRVAPASSAVSLSSPVRWKTGRVKNQVVSELWLRA